MFYQILLFLISSLLITLSQGVADCGSSFYGSIAFRDDFLKVIIDTFDTPARRSSISQQMVDDIRICEFGLTGEHVFNSGLFLAGFAKVGAICSGKYLEEYITIHCRNHRGSITDGRGGSADVSLAVGYQIPLCYSLVLQPAVGWSYDYLRIKLEDTTMDEFSAPNLEGLEYTNFWQGPWVGIRSQASWQRGDVGSAQVRSASIRSGYEYHRPSWKADFTLGVPDSPTGAYSDRRRHARHAYGHVAWTDISCTLPSCWEVGSGFKAGYWKSKKGIATPVAGNSAVGLPPDSRNYVRENTWMSFSIKLFCGLQF